MSDDIPSALPIPSALRLEPVGENRWAVNNAEPPGSVVFGGQLLGQIILCASRHSEGKSVQNVHCVFARAGRSDEPTELAIETMHAGRAFASHTVTVWQRDRLCARALVWCHGDDEDLIHHQANAPKIAAPPGGTIRRDALAFPGAEYAIVDDVDLSSADAPVAPAELSMWYRSTSTPDHRDVNQAVLAWFTDGFLIATAMRPHTGVGQERAHRDLSTGVLTHTLTFHRPFSLADWVLLSLESPFAGGGRSYGRCQVFDRAGALVASFVQDSMIRTMPGARSL